MDKIHFYKSEEIYPLAKKVFEEEKARLNSLFPDLIIEHVGASCVPGALTLGDLDINIRVSGEQFNNVSNKISEIYCACHKDKWTNEFALFKKHDHKEIPISISLTVINSKYDNFCKARDLFIKNKDFLEKYNNLKISFEGKELNDYRKAKLIFWGPNGDNKIIENNKIINK